MSDNPLMLQYTKASEWVDAKPVRERALIGLSIIAVCFLIWNFLIQSPHDKRSAALQEQLAQLANERKTAQEQLTGLASAFASDPAKTKQAEIDQLNIILQGVEQQLSGVSQSLIVAEHLPQVLENVFHQTQGLELISIKTLAAQEMMITQLIPEEAVLHEVQASSSSSESSLSNAIPEVPLAVVAKAEVKVQGSGVYKHGVVLRLRGDFFRVIALIKSLENLSWKFYWENLDYKVVQYPNAEIELKVFTLSSEEGLLGV